MNRNRYEATRRTALAGAAGALSAAMAGFGGRRAFAGEELNALVWCDHTDPALLAPFEESTGAKVNVKDYEGTGTALSLVEQSQPGDWDVFVVDSVDVPRVAEMGLLAELPDDAFPWGDIFPELRQPDLHYRDGKLYAVPEKFGYNAIAYNRDRVDPADMRRAEMMWNDKYAGRYAIYDYYIPTMELVGLGLGVKPAELTADKLGPIRDKLLRMKTLAAVVGDVVTVQNALVTGAADIIISGGEYAVSGLMTENPALDWVIPDEGGIRWGQAIGVFAASTKRDLATQFVQYIVGAQGQGLLATSSCYWAMPSNRTAALDAGQKLTLRWDEQPGFLANSHNYFIPDAALDQAMLDVWTEFLQA
ncbi:MAG: extracellular solute-binding protein [Alphaproteobacteria bacterium]